MKTKNNFHLICNHQKSEAKISYIKSTGSSNYGHGYFIHFQKEKEM